MIRVDKTFLKSWSRWYADSKRALKNPKNEKRKCNSEWKLNLQWLNKTTN